MMRSIPVLVLPLVLLTSCGEPASDNDEKHVKQVETSWDGYVETPAADVDSAEFWQRCLEIPEPLDGPGPSTFVMEVPLVGSPPTPDRLASIRLPANPTRDQVREYVCEVLNTVDRNCYGPDDPEIEVLERVGHKHADILLEPLLVHPHLHCSSYLIHALESIACEEHRALLVKHLGRVDDLIDVIAHHGWTEDAVPMLLSKLSDRDPMMFLNLIEAVAPHATPEYYEDLKFQLAEGDNPRHIWSSIRHLPGMGSLKDIVTKRWQITNPEHTFDLSELAKVVAHYGNKGALWAVLNEVAKSPMHEVFLNRVLHGKMEWTDEAVFFRLTGRLPHPIDETQAWLSENFDRLQFDPKRERYWLPAAGKKSGR